jgi:HEAT repeat protein
MMMERKGRKMTKRTSKLRPIQPITPFTADTQTAFRNTPRTVRLLVASLRIDNQRLNMNAVRDLIAIGRPAVPHLITALADDNARVWRLAAAALVKIGADAVDELVAALNHENAQVRLLAAAVLHKNKALNRDHPGWGAMWHEVQQLVNQQQTAQ